MTRAIFLDWIKCSFFSNKTSIPFKKRLKQHMDDLKPERSMENVKHATAEHQRTTGHTVAFDYPEIIASTQWKSQLDTFENIAISLSSFLKNVDFSDFSKRVPKSSISS